MVKKKASLRGPFSYLRRTCASRLSAVAAALHDAMIAELLDGARGKRRFDRARDAADMPALMAGDAGLRRQRRRSGKTMVGAGRALPDRAEDE